jgi:hypothetical protein
VFLGKLADDGYQHYYNALSFHPYPEALDRSPEDNAFPEILDEAKKLLTDRFPDKELWITEMGWPTAPGGVSDLDQANYLVRALTISMHKKIAKFFWFNLMDWTPWFNNGDFGAHTGLLDSNYHPKPSAAAYNIATYMLPTMTPTTHRRQGKAEVYSFDIQRQSVKFGGAMHVAWTNHAPETETIELPIVNGTVFAIDYLGAERKGELVGSDPPSTGTADALSMMQIMDNPTTFTYRFHITHEPLYIWDAIMPRPKKTMH